jgi:predicted DNA-binding transcriptional regulator AlpA
MVSDPTNTGGTMTREAQNNRTHGPPEHEEGNYVPNRRLIAGKAVYGQNGCTTLSRSTIWAMVKAGSFPAPIPISANRVAWLLDEVQAWIEARTAQAAFA